MTIILFIVGVLLLIVGASWLVKSSKSLALACGISPLVVGLTVVALGTSAPEFAVSVGSAISGKTDIAVGNVVGSNIANILLILGLSAGFGALTVNRQLLSFDGPVMIATAAGVLLMSLDGKIGWIDGLILVLCAFAYLFHTVKLGRRSAAGNKVQDKRSPAKPHFVRNFGLLAVSVGLLVLGARWMVDGAVVLAKSIGVSELVIGLTVVAVGTSLPEIATSVVASIKGERDLAIGNVIGSNIINVLLILGASGIAGGSQGLTVNSQTLWLEIPIMIAVSAMLLPMLSSSNRICAKEGLVLLAGYGLYLFYTVVNASLPLLWPSVIGATVMYGIWATATIRKSFRKEVVASLNTA